MNNIIKKRITLPWLRLVVLSIVMTLLIGFGAQESFASSTTFHDDANMLNSAATSNWQNQANGLPSKTTSLTSIYSTSLVSMSHVRRSSTTRTSSSSRRSSNSGFQLWWLVFIVVVAIISFISHARGRMRTLNNDRSKGIGLSNGYQTGEQVGQNKHTNYVNGFTAGGSDWGSSDNSSSSFTFGSSDWGNNDNSSSSLTTSSNDWGSSSSGGSDWSSSSGSSDWGSSGGSFDSGNNGNSSNW